MVEVIIALAGLLVLGMAFLGGVILMSEADDRVAERQAQPHTEAVPVPVRARN